MTTAYNLRLTSGSLPDRLSVVPPMPLPQSDELQN